MAAHYGAVALPVGGLPAARRRTGRLAAAAAALLVAGASVCALLAAALPGPSGRRAALLQRAARMNMVPLAQSQMLCEGHFLDTATGIPEGTYSTLHHPGELEGYAEPLPAEMRAAIDAEVYGAMVRPPTAPTPTPTPTPTPDVRRCRVAFHQRAHGSAPPLAPRPAPRAGPRKVPVCGMHRPRSSDRGPGRRGPVPE